jgi:hypothetical protein
MPDNDIIMAVYDAQAGAEEAVESLQSYGFDMKKMSIVAENSHAEERGVLAYEVAIKTDRFLLLVHGTANEAIRAREILMGTHPAELHTRPVRHAKVTDSAEQVLVPVLVAK